jgi:3-phosphoshikimate 1-carboxyvinyltransferase
VTFTVRGSLTVPGDKSISHRALMLGALSEGTSTITGLLESDDIRATAGALNSCGVSMQTIAGTLHVTGVGKRGLRAPTSDIDCANSGTSARLLAGILAAHEFTTRLVGDASLSRRPMRRVARPLEAMGATLESENNDGLPMRIVGGALRGIDWVSETASAQVKSAILLAGYNASVPVSIAEPFSSRDHTERMMRAFGARIEDKGQDVCFIPDGSLRPFDITIPGDPSSAAFFVAAAMMASRAELRLTGVGLNPTRTGFLDLARRMGARIDIEDARDEACEPLGTLVCRPGSLEGITVGGPEVPGCIDELPLIAVLGARAEGETIVSGAAELRVKESDRISAVVTNLRALGAQAEERPDGFVVAGSDVPLRGTVKTHGDHRIAMAFGVLAALPGNDITIDDPECVGVSYPGFWDDLRRVSR